MITVTLYSREDCHLCEQAKADLEALQVEFPHQLVEVDLDGDRHLEQAYGEVIPVVEIGPYRLKSPFTRQELHLTLSAAVDRARQIEVNEATLPERLQGTITVTGADRFSYWLSNHYMAIFNLFVLIYFGLPFLAPFLMASGFFTPARLIYRAYGSMCHQFAFRSWFLFGEQYAYPRAAAGVDGLLTFGEASGLDENDQWAARDFIGNPDMGYKVALCERDVAIYGGILLFGLFFAISGRRIKPLPWYLWILIGIIPIGLDGFTQILSQPPFDLIPPLHLLEYRESTPFLRTLTGGLFGLTTAWFGYPMVEETMKDTRRYMAHKFALAKGIVKRSS